MEIGTEAWMIRKPVVASAAGVVAAQTAIAAAIGAEVLETGGNAIDAAVTAGLAAGVVEPWMCGLGGGAMLVIHRADEDRTVAIDGGMGAAAGLDPADYPLIEGESEGLFAWPRVAGDANIEGYRAVLVPGQVAALALALERHGTRDWDEAVEPALRLAEAGVKADWPTTLMVAKYARNLRRDPVSAGIWLPDGLPPVMVDAEPDIRIHNPALAQTLADLQDAGPEDFYRGRLARAIAADLAGGGSRITAADLAACRAEERAPLSFGFRGRRLATIGGLSGGPTLARMLELIEAGPGPGSEAAARADALVAALTTAFTERLAALGDGGADADPARASCTTHICVIDAAGNAVSLTQTLLSGFGARVTLPATGILMNNAVMWFDPRPGGPNALGPGRRPLANMAPVLGLEAGAGAWLALGASGGRRIMPALAQVLEALIGDGTDLETALHRPRLDVDGLGRVTLDRRLPAPVRALLADTRRAAVRESLVSPDGWARPNAVRRDPATGRIEGTAAAHFPTDAAIAAREG